MGSRLIHIMSMSPFVDGRILQDATRSLRPVKPTTKSSSKEGRSGRPQDETRTPIEPRAADESFHSFSAPIIGSPMTRNTTTPGEPPRKRKIKRLRLRLDDEVPWVTESHRVRRASSPARAAIRRGGREARKNESTILREMLSEKLSLRQPNGRIKKIPALEGIHRKQLELALKGDVKSAAFVLNRFAALVSGEFHGEELNADDIAVLDAFARRVQGKNDGSQ